MATTSAGAIIPKFINTRKMGISYQRRRRQQPKAPAASIDIMGFLHKLWDETVAGPAPESGLGKLRKYNSFSGGRSSPLAMDMDVPVSRSITIIRTPSGYTSESPTGSTPPLSPFSPGTPSSPGHLKRNNINRRKSSAEPLPRADPNDFDRIFLSGLDR